MSNWALAGGFFPAFDTGDTTTVSLASIKAKTDQLTFTVSNQVDANIRSVDNVTVNGIGTTGSPWGP